MALDGVEQAGTREFSLCKNSRHPTLFFWYYIHTIFKCNYLVLRNMRGRRLKKAMIEMTIHRSLDDYNS